MKSHWRCVEPQAGPAGSTGTSCSTASRPPPLTRSSDPPCASRPLPLTRSADSPCASRPSPQTRSSASARASRPPPQTRSVGSIGSVAAAATATNHAHANIMCTAPVLEPKIATYETILSSTLTLFSFSCALRLFRSHKNCKCYSRTFALSLSFSFS